jgi:hypothetical protein
MDKTEEETEPKPSELLAAGYNDSMCRDLMDCMRGSSVEEIKRAQLDCAFSNGYVGICPRCHDSLVLSQLLLCDYLEEIMAVNDAVDRATQLTRIAEICGVDIEGRFRYLRDTKKAFLLCAKCAEKVRDGELWRESIELWPLEQGSS